MSSGGGRSCSALLWPPSALRTKIPAPSQDQPASEGPLSPLVPLSPSFHVRQTISESTFQMLSVSCLRAFAHAFSSTGRVFLSGSLGLAPSVSSQRNYLLLMGCPNLGRRTVLLNTDHEDFCLTSSFFFSVLSLP